MYSGFSTSIGSIVGRVGGSSNLTELTDIIDSVGAEESLVCLDGNNVDVHMSSMLSTQTGDVMWLPLENANFVKLKTMSMSQMSSMLRDDYRNSVYEAAIQKSIDSFRQHYQRNPVILDIGTGTGLLAMLCAKYGAEAVFAVEMFDLLAETAQENINRNGMSEKIMIIQGRSSDIEALPVPVDIIVSELLDSALLGECVIPSHADAISRFMNLSDAEGPNGYPLENRVIPHSAEMYATLVQSTEVNRMVSIHNIMPVDLPGSEHSTIFRETEYSPHCAGGWGLYPVHWKQIVARSQNPQNSFAAKKESLPAKVLSDAIPCMHAEFWHTNPQLTHKDNSGYAMFDTEIEVKDAGLIHGVLFHWKAKLLSSAIDPGQSVVYSTDPATLEQYPFQDHWKQCVYPLPHPIQVYRGQILQLRVCHDDLRVWAFVTVSASSPPPPTTANSGALGMVCGDASQLPRVTHHLHAPIAGSNEDELESMLGKKRNRNAKEVKRSLSCMVSKEFQEAFAMQPCSCGWHLLHDNHTTAYWNDHTQRKHIQSLVMQLSTQIISWFSSRFIDPVSGLLRLQILSAVAHRDVEAIAAAKAAWSMRILDDADGSLLSILVAQAVRHHLQPLVEQTHAFARAAGISSQPYVLPEVVFVSVEKRQFSRMFYMHLTDANGLYVPQTKSETDEEGDHHEVLSIQSQIVRIEIVESPLGNSPSTGTEGEEGMDADDVPSASATSSIATPPHYDIILSLTNRRQYTLNALPLWQALSFLYSTRHFISVTTQHHLDHGALLPPSIHVAPQQARVMMIPFQSSRLCRGHGPIRHPVRELDHTAYDEQISGIWSAFLYPYHVAEYSDMRFLTLQPVEVYSLRFQDQLNENTVAWNYRRNATRVALTEEFVASRQEYLRQTGENIEARIDGVIFYVEYIYANDQTSNDAVVSSPWQADIRNFAPYEIQSVKFFASSYPVYDNGATEHASKHDGYEGIRALQVEVALDSNAGETSDFEISFSFF